MVLGGAPLPAAPAGHPEADARKAEAELQAVKSEIERITRQVSLEQVERDRLTQELRTSELSVGKLRDELSEVRSERAARAARRAALTAEQQAREAEVQRNRAALAGQLRAAYLIGRQEPLKLLLRSEEHTSELQSPCNLVCRLLLEKKKQVHNRRNVSSPRSQ